MNILTGMRERVDRLVACEELDVEASRLVAGALRLSDASLIAVMADVAAIVNDAERVQAVLAGIAAQRSARDRGHTGLSAVQGHASPVSLVQSITGGTRADATRYVRVGTAMLEDLDTGTGAGAPGGVDMPDVLDTPVGTDDGDAVTGADGGNAARVVEVVWHEPLRRALLDGTLTSAQHDAIRRGLGEPPVPAAPDATTGQDVAADTTDPDPDGADGADAENVEVDPALVREAWSLAADGLIGEAGSMPVEELVKRARTIRDMLDPAGAEARYARRFENRSFRRWVDADGQHRGSIVFDDEMGLWVDAILNAGLRPRRGGPRFVDPDEKTAAENLVADPRSNDQLAYDLIMDVLRAGALAETKDVFGTRQPGVRLVIVKDPAGADLGPRDTFGRLLTTGHAEDGCQALPGPVIDRNACANGRIEVIIDPSGNPLDLGREARLYSGKQRLTLAIRDGGCIWPGCTRPASYCEAHREHERAPFLVAA